MTLINSLFIAFLFVSSSTFGNNTPIDDIKSIIKNDFEKKNKEKINKKKREAIQNKTKKNKKLESDNKYYSWKILNRLWLVENVDVLKWNFDRPDYGLNKVINDTLKRTGYSSVKYKIILSNSNITSHTSLPGKGSEVFIILSKIFLERMDVTKQEIALLVLEELVRSRKYKNIDTLEKRIGRYPRLKNRRNYKKDVNAFVRKAFKVYDELVYNYKSNFKEEYAVHTILMNSLASEQKLLNSYLNLQKKLTALLETTIFSNYPNVYPSPELRIRWMTKKFR